MTGRTPAAHGKSHAAPRRVALLCAALAALAATFAPVARAAGPSFSLEPVDAPTDQPYFIFNAKPGGRLTGKVRVVNAGDKPGAVRLDAVDGTTGQTSGAVYRSRQEARRDVGGWVTLGQTQLELAPGQDRTVAFQLAVPTSLRSGQHLGGIVAENLTLHQGRVKSRNRGKFQINIRNLTVMAVQVNAPGSLVSDMSIGDVKAGGSQGGHQSVLIGLGNDGNVMLKPALSVKVADDRGAAVQRRELKLDTFVPKTRIDYPVPVQGKALRPGAYTAYITLRFAGKTISAVRKFTVSSENVKQIFGDKTPLAQGGGGSLLSYLPWVLLALAALAGAARYIRNRRRRPPASPGEGPAAPPRSPVGSPNGHSANGWSQADLERLLAEVDQLGVVWFLRQIAEGALHSNGEASAEQIQKDASEGVTQETLDAWSANLAAAAERVGMSTPFSELRVGALGVVYRMDPKIAGAVQRLVDTPE